MDAVKVGSLGNLSRTRKPALVAAVGRVPPLIAERLMPRRYMVVGAAATVTVVVPVAPELSVAVIVAVPAVRGVTTNGPPVEVVAPLAMDIVPLTVATAVLLEAAETERVEPAVVLRVTPVMPPVVPVAVRLRLVGAFVRVTVETSSATTT